MSYRKTILFSLLIVARFSCETIADDVVAYRGATIETVAEAGTIKDGIIVVRDGKIEAVGVDVKIPASARVVDVSGQTIMPGLVNIYHPVSGGDTSAPTESRTVVVGGRTFTIPGAPTTVAPSFSKISDNLDPLSLKSALQTQARYGVGFVNIVTRGYGQSVNVKVVPDDVENCIVNKDGLLFLAVTNNTASLDVLRSGLRGRPSTSGGGSGFGGRSGGSRFGRGGGGGGGQPTPTPAPTPTETPASAGSSLTSLWQSVKDGNTPIVLNVNNASTIMYVLDIKKEFDKVKIVLVASGANIYQTKDDLKDKGISVLLRAGLDVAPRSSDRINVPKLLADSGINFGFSSSLDSSLESMPDTPFFPVALLVKTGLPRKAALEALTLAPAKMLGLEKTVGSIEAGKQANLVFLDGDPLAAASRVQRVLVEGKSVYED